MRVCVCGGGLPSQVTALKFLLWVLQHFSYIHLSSCLSPSFHPPSLSRSLLCSHKFLLISLIVFPSSSSIYLILFLSLSFSLFSSPPHSLCSSLSSPLFLSLPLHLSTLSLSLSHSQIQTHVINILTSCSGWMLSKKNSFLLGVCCCYYASVALGNVTCAVCTSEELLDTFVTSCESTYFLLAVLAGDAVSYQYWVNSVRSSLVQSSPV